MRLVKINGYRSGTTETGKPWETSRVTEEHGPGQSGDVPGSGRSSLSLRLRGSSPLGSTTNKAWLPAPFALFTCPDRESGAADREPLFQRSVGPSVAHRPTREQVLANGARGGKMGA